MLLPEMLGPKPYQNTRTLFYKGDPALIERLPGELASRKIKLARIATIPGRQHWHLQKGWGSVLFRARTAADLSGLELELMPAPGILRRASSCRLQKEVDALLLQCGAQSQPPPAPAS